MDPNEALEQIRQAVARYHNATSDLEITFAAEAVINGFEDLDRWLSRGGFAPQAWDRSDPRQREQYQAEVEAGRIREARYV